MWFEEVRISKVAWPPSSSSVVANSSFLVISSLGTDISFSIYQLRNWPEANCFVFWAQCSHISNRSDSSTYLMIGGKSSWVLTCEAVRTVPFPWQVPCEINKHKLLMIMVFIFLGSLDREGMSAVVQALSLWWLWGLGSVWGLEGCESLTLTFLFVKWGAET